MTIPYNLQYGDSVFAQITATNIIGTSGVSASGNGAVLLTAPYAPVNLANLPLITSGSKIGIIWQAGSLNGGAPVLDYTVSWDNATTTGTYLVLAQNVLATTYNATGIQASLTYSFVVQARNIYGLSNYSQPVSILSAQTPNTPAAPTTLLSGSNMIINWVAPGSGGSSINGYQIWIQTSVSTVYLQNINACDG